MLTARVWWLLLFVLVQAVVSLLLAPRGAFFVTVLGLAVLLWFLGEWLLFARRVWRLTTAVSLRREVRDDRGAVDTLWAGRSFGVRVRLELTGRGPGLPYVLVEDRLPAGVEVTAGERGGPARLTA